MSALPNPASHNSIESSAGPTITTVNIHQASTPAEVRTALSLLHAQKDSLIRRLETLLSRADLSRDFGRLDHPRAGLRSQAIATRAIANNMLSGAASTAGLLRDKVKELDLEKSRVEETLVVLEQVAELKACVHGVVGSMRAPQDWEAAAWYISQAAKVPEEIIRGSFAANVVPSIEAPDPPWVTLEKAKESLCRLFLREFERATREGDEVKATGFFKLFPLIGKRDTGLDVYGRYVCQDVAGMARKTLKPEIARQKESFLYADALGKLFQHIIQIVELHTILVERHYGAGEMVKVIERLQMEVDVQGGIILDSWSDERRVDRRLMDVKSYSFSFLMQSFLPPQRGASRTNSPGIGTGANNAQEIDDEGVGLKEVDELLGEIAAMLGWWSSYVRFIAGKSKDEEDTKDESFSIPEILLESGLNRKISRMLTTPYNTMTTFFFRRSVEKAFQLNEFPNNLSLNLKTPIDNNRPFIITAVDDIIFIINRVIQRSLPTSQREVITSVVLAMDRVLSSDFVGMIQRKMRDEFYPRPLIQGGFPPEDKIIAFIVLINSLDTANEYLARIMSDLSASPGKPDGVSHSSPLRSAFPFGRDLGSVATSPAHPLSTFAAKTTELLNEGLSVLFNQVIKLRLRPILSDAFRDVDYSLSEDEFASAQVEARETREEGDTLQRFGRGWDQLMRPINRIMTPKPYTALLDLTTRHLARVLEKRLWSYVGRASPLGGIRMESDFLGIISVVARENYSAKELFSRVLQVLMVANMEQDEWEELSSLAGCSVDWNDGIRWVLAEEERTKARSLIMG
ncbi:COG4 transport protein-domain-containing protein [Durotheca rogersii]|uniref:COG4 transport protein-domain-containing protein n=1 Tax=Durotheca rogersii TaxID=419775 RepID=UPI00221E9526|nr:COG4 transport protein-domain-containing protein [Durotheca rogersii]KAI5859742.1 COG4 transport protein-domain-containing protein [Durotheca rogersii]